MDNPNAKTLRRRHTTQTVNVRRHKSLPGPLRSIRTSSSRRSTPAPVKPSLPRPTPLTAPRPQQSPQPQQQQQTPQHHAQPGHASWSPLSKSNPYVGWFRHAPPIAALHHGQKRVLWFDPSSTPKKYMKRCCSSSTSTSVSCYYYTHKHHHHHHNDDSAIDWIQWVQTRGVLRGGGRSSDWDTFWNDHVTSSHNDCSVTAKVVSRLACWWLDVPKISTEVQQQQKPQQREDAAATPKYWKEEEDVGHAVLGHPNDAASLVSDDDDDESSSSEYDNYDTILGSRHRGSSVDMANLLVLDDGQSGGRAAVLSSQAEAYYAQTLVHSQILLPHPEYYGSSSSSSSFLASGGRTTTAGTYRPRSSSLGEESSSSASSSRLDYDITQMDILKMNRIASRHLDVESILRLPVLTYGPAATDAVADHERPSKPLPQQQPRNQNNDTPSEATTARKQGPILVDQDDSSFDKEDSSFSWMLVPPSRHVSNDDSNGTDLDTSGTTPPLPSATTQDDVCVICLDPFVPGDRLRVLPCSHSFHVGCIDRWLSGAHSFDDCYTSGCPTCKKRPTATAAAVSTTTTHQSSSASTSSKDHPSQSSPPVCRLDQSDGSVPSWAFARLGDALSRESRHF